MFEILSGGLLGSIFGGIFRLAPEVLKFFDKKNEREHELHMFSRQCELEQLRGQMKLAEIGANREAAMDVGVMEAFNNAITQQAEMVKAAGGWVASFTDRTPDLGLVGRVVQNDVARPLHVPEFGTLAPGAWVLDLRRHGSVLFADQHSDQPGSPLAPYSMHFDRLGREQDAVRALPAIPTAAAALRGGDYVAMWRTAAATLTAQRYAPRGRPVGTPFELRAAADAQAAGLQRAGMALAWVETDAVSSRVVTQRFDEPAAH